METSIILATWTNKDHQLGISRQIAIPYEIDPLDLGEAEIRTMAEDQGFAIYGDLSWEVLIDNSRFCYMSEDRKKAFKLGEKIDRLISDLQDMANELAETASRR